MCHVSCVMCHVSCVKCRLSPVTCQNNFFLHNKIYITDFFLSLKKLDKVVELVGGGSVLNGAYPVLLMYYFVNKELDFSTAIK